MPLRWWKHGIHEFLEFNRRRLETEGGILEHMMATFFMDHNMLALLWETAASIQEPSPVVVKPKTQMSPQVLPHERRRREHEEYNKKRHSVQTSLKRTSAECLGDISCSGSIFLFWMHLTNIFQIGDQRRRRHQSDLG